MVYSELRDRGIEILAIALDSAGHPAVEAKARPTDLINRPDVLRKLRGWTEAQWSAASTPTFPCLIDEEHRVADLYGMRNVPTAVWIDETGQIVRPAEPAGVSDHFRKMDPDTFAVAERDAAALEANRERYIEALRDWVAQGPGSEFALSPDDVRQRLRAPAEEDVRAAVHVRVAHYAYRQGQLEAAKRHLAEAVSLCPEKWNYRRQAMVLEPELVGALNVSEGYYAAMDALGERDFYPPIEMPGMIGQPG